MSSYGDTMAYFPQCTPEEFNEACHYFDLKYITSKLGPERRSWKMSLQRSLLTGEAFLLIVRPLVNTDETDGTQDLSELLELLSWGGEGGGMLDAANIDVKSEVNDHEALRPSDSGNSTPPRRLRQNGSVDLGDMLPGYSVAPKQPYVVYEIHYHSIYQTPCLWFALRDLPPCDKAWEIETVFRYIVPEAYKEGLRSMGLANVLSCAPNPVTGVPSFFLHPCQTTDALVSLVSQCSLKEYIQIWLGLMGQCVGLQVPVAMASAMI